MARLSLCSLVFALALALPSSAAATLISPKILSTTPASEEGSPANSTTPSVIGEAEPADGIITSVAKPSPFGSRLPGGTATGKPTEHPEYEIFIYTQANCEGPAVGSGLAEQFEASGIPVTVAPNALTMLYANQVNPSEPMRFSACSGAFPYWEGAVASGGGPSGGGGSSGQGGGGSSAGPGNAGGSGESIGPGVTTGKPEAPAIHMTPKAIANDTSPSVAGSAPGAGTVLVYADGNCSGSPVAMGAAAQLGAGLTVQVADNTTTAFSAVAVGGQRSGCSSPVTYVEDSTPPRTRVTMGPGVKTRKRKVVFRFADVTPDPPGTIFFCKVDEARWKPCSSPLRLGHLKLRRYVVRFRAVDLAGNREKVGAKRVFKVVPRS